MKQGGIFEYSSWNLYLHFFHPVSSLIDFVFDRFRSSNPAANVCRLFLGCRVWLRPTLATWSRIWKMHCPRAMPYPTKGRTSGDKGERESVEGERLRQPWFLTNFHCIKPICNQCHQKNNFARGEIIFTILLFLFFFLRCRSNPKD